MTVNLWNFPKISLNKQTLHLVYSLCSTPQLFASTIQLELNLGCSAEDIFIGDETEWYIKRNQHLLVGLYIYIIHIYHHYEMPFPQIHRWKIISFRANACLYIIVTIFHEIYCCCIEVERNAKASEKLKNCLMVWLR